MNPEDICFPPLNCSDEEFVDYIKSMEGGERIKEMGVSCLTGYSGTVEVKDGDVLIRWDPVPPEKGQMVTSFTGGARVLEPSCSACDNGLIWPFEEGLGIQGPPGFCKCLLGRYKERRAEKGVDPTEPQKPAEEEDTGKWYLAHRPSLTPLLEGIEISLTDDLTLGRAVIHGHDPMKDSSPIVAFLHLQQKFLDLCDVLGHKVTRKITGVSNLKPQEPPPPQKPTPPEGYRLLEEGEYLRKSDVYYRGGRWRECNSYRGKWNPKTSFPAARKIEGVKVKAVKPIPKNAPISDKFPFWSYRSWFEGKEPKLSECKNKIEFIYRLKRLSEGSLWALDLTKDNPLKKGGGYDKDKTLYGEFREFIKSMEG